MARKMRKFSEGGAQGKYDRRMADIKKDFAKDSAGKSGKALEVLEAKRMQRTADAEDDRAKRTGGDRTATRAAERAAESNLTKTRKYGAPQSVTAEAPTTKVTDTLGAITAPKMDSSIGAKPKSFGAAFKEARARLGAGKTFTYNGKSFTTNIGGEGRKSSTSSTNIGAGASSSSTNNNAAAAARDAKAKQDAAAAKDAKAKGGKIMKYAKGGSTPPQPTAAERKADAKFRESVKKIKVTPENAAAIGRGNRSEKRFAAGGVTKEMPSSKAMGSMNMAKGGKAKMKPAAKGKAKGNPFAATKFGAAMMKKSADTKGRAMPKFAKGGSIDGCAVKGKTKLKRVTMKKGGSC